MPFFILLLAAVRAWPPKTSSSSWKRKRRGLSLEGYERRMPPSSPRQIFSSF